MGKIEIGGIINHPNHPAQYNFTGHQVGGHVTVTELKKALANPQRNSDGERVLEINVYGTIMVTITDDNATALRDYINRDD